MKKPQTFIERLNIVEAYIRNTEPAFPNSVMCFDTGLLLKQMEIESEHLPPTGNELVNEIIGSLHTLFRLIDNNDDVGGRRNEYRTQALRQIASLRDFLLLNRIA